MKRYTWMMKDAEWNTWSSQRTNTKMELRRAKETLTLIQMLTHQNPRRQTTMTMNETMQVNVFWIVEKIAKISKIKKLMEIVVHESTSTVVSKNNNINNSSSGSSIEQQQRRQQRQWQQQQFEIETVNGNGNSNNTTTTTLAFKPSLVGPTYCVRKTNRIIVIIFGWLRIIQFSTALNVQYTPVLSAHCRWLSSALLFDVAFWKYFSRISGMHASTSNMP